MFKKRYITLAVLTFLVCILAASAASAADGDNLTDDALAIDASDEGNIAIEEDNGEEIISSPDGAEPIAVDEDGSDDVASVDEGQEVGELFLGEQGLDLDALLSGVSSHHLIETASALEFAYDVLADLFVF